MLVIHPKDRTTAMLSVLYEGSSGARLLDDPATGKEIERAIHHTPISERIMLLGHGSDRGLFWRKDDMQPFFDGILIGHKHAFHLRRHGANLVAVFCNANLFALGNGLHGLFSGMIITEKEEAAEYGITISEEELKMENVKLFQRLRQLLDKAVPLSDIPRLILDMDDVHTPLTEFNYRNFFYL